MHPILEWLFVRFMVTESTLRDWAQHDAACRCECGQVLRGNGYEEDPTSATLIQEAQAAAVSFANLPLDESEKPALLLVATTNCCFAPRGACFRTTIGC